METNTSNTSSNTNCCPPFDPIPWDGKVIEWKDKKFVTGSVITFFYWPLNFGSVISRMMKAVDAASAEAHNEPCLSEHTSKWNMDLYIPVNSDVPGLTSTTLSGKFFFKAYEGGYKEIDGWMKDFEKVTKEKGMSITRQFFWYTTCPKCAKAYGKNYVVLVGELK